MDLLEVVVAVEECQAPDEGHHHQLHGGPGRLGLQVAGGADNTGGVIDRISGLRSVVVFSPNSEDTDEEGQGGHDHLPGLGGAELPVTPEDFPHTTGQHPRALS